MAGDSPAAQADRDERLTIYAMFVESAQQVTAKRHDANRYYISAVAAMGVAYSYALTQLRDAAPLHFMIAIAAAAICLVWFTALTRFKELNRAKFRIILEIEARLVEKPFTREDELFMQRRGGWIPDSFAATESSLAAGGLLSSLFLAFFHLFRLLEL
jgi:hypothetical protein